MTKSMHKPEPTNMWVGVGVGHGPTALLASAYVLLSTLETKKLTKSFILFLNLNDLMFSVGGDGVAW